MRVSVRQLCLCGTLGVRGAAEPEGGGHCLGLMATPVLVRQHWPSRVVAKSLSQLSGGSRTA